MHITLACPTTSYLQYRFVVGGTPSTLPTFEQKLFGPFTIILQQDIDRMLFPTLTRK